MLVALGSWRGSPGVTTSALAMAEEWPGEQRVYVVECDPRGGTLAARFVMPGTRRLVSLVGDARNSSDLGLLAKHAVATPSGAQCVTGPERGTQLRAGLAKLVVPGGLFEAAAADPNTVVLADCGRLEPETAEMAALLLLADVLVVVVRPESEHVLHLSGVGDEIESLHSKIGLLLVGRGNSPEQVSGLLGLPVFGHLPTISAQPATKLIQRVGGGFGRSGFSKAAASASSAIAQAAQSIAVAMEGAV